jgi:two-component system, LytTR family, response regulator
MKILLIDDEALCTELLQKYVHQYFPQHEIVAVCNTAESGLQSIQTHQPDLVFLDVEMPKMNGFQLLDMLGKQIDFNLIFITAYDHYAIKAFKYSAIDYLLKPIDRKELIEAIEKATTTTHKMTLEQHAIARHIHAVNEPDMIALSTTESITFTPIVKIIRQLHYILFGRQ